jgi:lipoyl(octanoyl) transferase
LARDFLNNIEHIYSNEAVDYQKAILFMEERVDSISKGISNGCLWFLEHPHIYTIGTSGNEADIRDKTISSCVTGRGGKVTYHGPGQRIVYVMLDLSLWKKDLRAYVQALEKWLQLTMQKFGLETYVHQERIGLWVNNQGQEQKIASIGVRVRKWVSYHGIALNIHNDLEKFKGIIPCGLADYEVCSMKSLGIYASMQDIDKALQETFPVAFSTR